MSDAMVVRVLPRIHRAHAIQFPNLNRGEQMIQGKRIVWMTRQDPLEILNRRVIVDVVVVLESGRVQRIGWTKRGRDRRSRCQTNSDKNQQYDGKESGAMPEEEGRHAYPV